MLKNNNNFFVNQMDFQICCIQLQLASVPNVMQLQYRDEDIVCMILGYLRRHQH